MRKFGGSACLENTKFTMVEITVFLLNMLEVDKAVFDGKKEESFCGDYADNKDETTT
jgi:hypothetical protein